MEWPPVQMLYLILMSSEFGTPPPDKLQLVEKADAPALKQAPLHTHRPVEIQHIEHSTNIDTSYGEKTWHPSQSIVDLLQNHLDANTSAFEKSRLKLVGISEYKPDQQAILESMSLFAAETDPVVQEVHFHKLVALLESSSGISTLLQDSQQNMNALWQQLQEVRYEVPELKLKLSNGQTSKFVSYTEVATEDSEWQVVGYLIADNGPGFDHALLGLMGATTKGEDDNRRGGLGEGLKMSLAQLNRVGADVRILSRNTDQSWWLKPQVNDGLLSLDGTAVDRKLTVQSPSEGSRTMVDLSQANMTDLQWREIRNILDSRISPEGIAKYVLEFHPDIAPEKLEGDALFQNEVPAGRVYVKGLLVEEDRSDLLWSYNLSDKWAISGRDRKTVDVAILDVAIIDKLTDLTDYESILQIVRLMNDPSTDIIPREVRCLRFIYKLPESQQSLWRQAIEEVFHFESGKTVFCPSNADFEHKRLAEQRGYTLLVVRPEILSMLSIISAAYDPSPVYRLDELVKQLTASDESTETIDKTFNAVLHHMVESYAADNLATIPRSQYQLGNLSFVHKTNSNADRFMTDFPYWVDWYKDTIAVDTDAISNGFARDADLLLATEMFFEWKSSFTDEVQHALGQMVASAVLRHHPELFEVALPSHIAERIAVDVPNIGYTNEQRQKDAVKIAFDYLEAQLYHLATDEDRQQFLASIEATKQLLAGTDADIVKSVPLSSFIYLPFHVAGQLKWVTEELEVADNAKDFPWLKLRRSPDEIDDLQSLNYMLLDIPVGQYKSYGYKAGDQKGRLVISRTDYGYSVDRIEDILTASDTSSHNQAAIDEKAGDNVQSFILGDLLYINLNQPDAQFYEIPTPQTTPLPEKNRGLEFISANTTLDYGSKVWSDPKRILIDAIQNHRDANGGQPPRITFQISNSQGETMDVDMAALTGMPSDWVIVSVSIEDHGTGYTTPYLVQMGSSTKTDADAGKFGEGLKMLTAAATRQQIDLRLESKDWQASPTSTTEQAIDHDTGQSKQFDVLAYNLKWSDRPRDGSMTTFSIFSNGHPWSRQQFEQLQRSEELLVNDAHVPQRIRTWRQWLDILDPRVTDATGNTGLDRFVLPVESEKFYNAYVSVLTDRPGQVFEKNLLIPDAATSLNGSKQLMFGYNLHQSTINTRERNAISPTVFKDTVSQYFNQDAGSVIFKEMLSRAKEDPQTSYYEYELLEESDRVQILLRQAYYDVFGDDAILSIASISEQQHQEELMKVHLERANTVFLPPFLTRRLSKSVYTTADYFKNLEGKEVEVTDQERAQLYTLATRVNQIVDDYYRQMLNDPDKLQYLSKGWLKLGYDQGEVVDVIRDRLAQLSQMNEQDIRVGSSLNPHGGMYKTGQDNRIKIEVSQVLLHNHKAFLEVYLHEVIHHMTGENDFELGFVRGFVALAMQADEHVQRLTKIEQKALSLPLIRKFLNARTRIKRR